MTQENNLQYIFLEHLKQEKTPVSIFLVNGIKLLGHIVDFDGSVILLKNVSTQVVYKHAISTICNTQLVNAEGIK